LVSVSPLAFWINSLSSSHMEGPMLNLMLS
jgi:hypothetical protein